MTAIGRRALAGSRGRWMPGMRGVDSSGATFRVLAVNAGRPSWIAYEDGRSRPYDAASLPDLTDPATLGCLMALVREVHGPHANTMASEYEPPERRWSVFGGTFGADDYGHEVARGPTEAEALVAALEAAP